jgi:uncharacterized C2H2 Zn-finger protein
MYAPMDSNEGDRTQCTFCEKAFAERHHFINHANKVKKHILNRKQDKIFEKYDVPIIQSL